LPLSAFSIHLTQLLLDANELVDTHTLVNGVTPPPQQKLDALNRSIVVTSVSAWETYVEELAMQPPALSVHGQCITHRSWDTCDDFIHQIRGT